NPQVGISMVPPEFVRDMLPADLREGHTTEITIQAPGASVFTTPMKITFPNQSNAPPGANVTIFSFDHTTGLVVLDGTGTVSADGLSISSDPGSGIRAPGWHFIDRFVNVFGSLIAPLKNPDCQLALKDLAVTFLSSIPGEPLLVSLEGDIVSGINDFD